MSEKLYVIYKFTSPSQKSYIGQSCDFNNRILTHKRASSNCRLIKAAINKYGWDSFSCDILEEGLTVDQANNREQYYICEFNTLVPNGYNLTTGGLNYTRSEETKKLMSIARTGVKRDINVVNKTNKNPDKIRKTALAHTGMKRSDEAKHNMSIARKQTLDKNGGALNKGMKMFYDPCNLTSTVLCLPRNAPVGWVNGNPRSRGKHSYQNVITNEIKWFPKGTILQDWVLWNSNVQGRKNVSTE